MDIYAIGAEMTKSVCLVHFLASGVKVKSVFIAGIVS
jgi:hypothetical protein